ncbi:TRAP-type mannitol/chloroaromatic compound transport system permease small subunit [Aquimarina sp. EL_43]|uniref:TRAP transporter small permease subunit n=1 Tax=Aquimarina TaxID=290174 RepID=UPI000471A45A|nr:MULTISPECIES: TRAP transporter small permease subunit [Aquimarina]MBG6130886.1 TRAP-type mannitol/chloroaromatic compound transport system permease small subunit [Aquimarina sp. EL_35]MBG6151345.1 TRAP-type mannitol/chloroaromatic compound transport system permease small subunit [Aquimarina sp. EL_32]MBG6169276.1 TRAP-type mannitol/chloroaromatic compound transport system permease small subunit [Aquimarina sp. EL_43]
MQKIINFLDRVGEKIGVLVSWVAALLAIVIGLDVIIRYIFKFTYVWMIEIEIYLFGMIFLLASGYTFKYEKHVRVDVFYTKLSRKGKAWVDLLGGALLLIPWCYVVIVSSWYYGLSSFMIGEGSPQPGGLPALYILKFCITLGFVFLLLQGISHMLKSIQIIFNKN